MKKHLTLVNGNSFLVIIGVISQKINLDATFVSKLSVLVHDIGMNL